MKGLGAALLALVLGFGGYLFAGVGKAEQAQKDIDVLRAEIHGKLAVIEANQAQGFALVQAEQKHTTEGLESLRNELRGIRQAVTR